MRYVVELGDCTKERSAEVGGKAIGLGSLIHAALPVPPGFAITTDGYRRSVQAAGVQEQITALLNTASSAGTDRVVSQQIIALFDDAMLDGDVAAEIDEAYARLSEGADMPVAVRSSATAEDLPDASFAGQQDTYLWIQGAPAVRAHVVRCWASLFTPRAIGYRARRDIPLDDLAMGVVVQQMVPADAAGVMMTMEPVRGDRSQIYIEAAYGLGEGVVRGDVGSDRFWVTKSSLTTNKQQIDPKQQAHRFDPARGEVCLTEVPADQQQQPALRDQEVIALADLGRQIEQHFDAPMDIEWAIAGSGDHREISLLQARPETVWSQKAESDPVDTLPDGPGGEVITGIGVSSGIVEGTARVVTSPDDDDVEPDEILVAPFTDPSWSSLMFISAGLVVDIGGALSHAAVVARELAIPCVVNTRTGTTTLRTGDRIKIDGTMGTVQIITRAVVS
jgi:phosphoenolpyruvate synthase